MSILNLNNNENVWYIIFWIMFLAETYACPVQSATIRQSSNAQSATPSQPTSQALNCKGTRLTEGGSSQRKDTSKDHKLVLSNFSSIRLGCQMLAESNFTVLFFCFCFF